MASVRRIETPRLVLREWRGEDADSWAKLNADPRVMEFYPSVWDRKRSDESARKISAYLEQNGWGLWAVEVKETGAFAGFIGIQEVPYEVPFTPPREIGWRLAYEYWGKGYAPEGARAALDFAFNKLGWDEVVAMTSLLNLRSQRVMQKLGMTRDAADDFDHPNIEPGHRLRRHLLYRIRKPRASDAKESRRSS